MRGLRIDFGIARGGGGGGFVPDFYVDSVNGNDANAGTEAAPFQTLGKVETEALAFGNGVKIGLVAGSHWREDLDLGTLDNVTIQGVGDLATDGLPLIDGSRVYASTWQTSADRADGLTNTYSITVTQTAIEAYISVWTNGTKNLSQTSAANVNTTPGSFFVSPEGASRKTVAGSITIFYHPPGSTNPNSDGKTVEITDWERAGDIRCQDGAAIRFIHARRNSAANGAVECRYNALIESCVVEDGVKHESLIHSGTYRKTVGLHTVSDARTNAIGLEVFTSDGSGKAFTYDRCAYHGPGGQASQVVVALGGHTGGGVATYYDAGTIVDCAVEDCTIAYEGVIDGPLTVTRFKAVNCKTAVTDISAVATITDPYVLVTEALTAVRSFILTAAHTIDGLRAYYAGTTDLNVNFGPGPGAATTTGSIIVLNAADALSYVHRTGNLSGRTINIDTTIFQLNTNSAVIWEWFTAGHQTLGTLENNVYFDNSTGTMNFNAGGTNYNNPVNYLAALPETGTITTNPGLVDPANGDFSLTAPLANGAGVQRFPTYLTVPANYAEAEAFVLA